MSQLSLAPVSALVEIGTATQTFDNKQLYTHLIKGGVQKVVQESHDYLNVATSKAGLSKRKAADQLAGAQKPAGVTPGGIISAHY